jgi:hypothetical protein
LLKNSGAIPEISVFKTKRLLLVEKGTRMYIIFQDIKVIKPPVEPYSMAFVTAPNKDVAKTLASGIGME